MSIKYRPDIDGLRALAVLLVIFNHLKISLFSGGFIGVDIFFVISGYLITSIMVKDIADRKFSFGTFYKKRVIRLAPAYFTVLLATTIMSFFVLLPNELSEYFKSLIYSTFMLANIYMAFNVGDYFSNSSDEIFLLHLWSLAVEEQFYLVWPLIIILLFKLFKKKTIPTIMLISTVLALIISEIAINIIPVKAYYLMPVRAFELMIGALIVFLPKLELSNKNRVISVYFSLLSILYCSIFYDSYTKFPGLYALIPCLATAAIIYIGKSQDRNIVLTNKLSIFIGKISYPMYLWHWPIIVLFTIFNINQSYLIKAIILFICIILSYLTYQYIELKAQNYRGHSNKNIIINGFVSPAILLSLITTIVIYSNGFPQRFSKETLEKSSALTSFAHVERKNCHYAPVGNIPNSDLCILGVDKPEIDFLFLGDSHANHFTGFIDILAKDANLRGFDITRNLTAYMPETKMYVKKYDSFVLAPDFYKHNTAVTNHIKSNKYKFIMISASFNSYFDVKLENTLKEINSTDAYFTGMKSAISNIISSGAKPILLLDNPNLINIKANCSTRLDYLPINGSCDLNIAQVEKENIKFNNLLARLKDTYPTLIIIDPNLAICGKEICQTEINGIPLFRDKDSNHLNYMGSQEIGRYYLQKYKNPLSQL